MSVPAPYVLSCSDSALSTTASIVGILTFIYALLAGLYVNARFGAQALRHGPQEFQDLLESLTASFEEYQVFAERLSEWREKDRALANRAARLADSCEAQLKELRGVLEGESPERLYSNRRYWWWSARFAVVQRRVRRGMEKKEEVMGELRRLQQAFHIRSQETDLLRQHQLLLDISHRLNVVEQRQGVLARASGVPLEEIPAPAMASPSAEDILSPPTFTSTEDIMLDLMRPRPVMRQHDQSLVSLVQSMPIFEDELTRLSVETWRDNA